MWEPYTFPKLKLTATGFPSFLALRITYSSPCISWVVLGKSPAPGVPSFTTKRSLLGAPPRKRPPEAFPFPAAIPKTAVPWLSLIHISGDHAKNDMAGEDPESWYSQFYALGYEVVPVIKGLGEYPSIRRLLVEHLTKLDSREKSQKTAALTQ